MDSRLKEQIAYEIYNFRNTYSLKGSKEEDWRLAEKYLKNFVNSMTVDEFIRSMNGFVVKLSKVRNYG